VITLRWTGRWARRRGVPAVMVSHESLVALFGLASCGRAGQYAADWLNRRTARGYPADHLHDQLGGRRVRADRGPQPGPRPARRGPDHVRGQAALRTGRSAAARALRLSAEKKPQRSLNTLASLRAGGRAARLVVAGDGPLRPRLERRAARDGLPVSFTGFEPAADPVGGVRLDGHQGNRLAVPALPRHGARAGGPGRAGMARPGTRRGGRKRPNLNAPT
jgi:alpha-1,6-mannosyltransferase